MVEEIKEIKFDLYTTTAVQKAATLECPGFSKTCRLAIDHSNIALRVAREYPDCPNQNSCNTKVMYVPFLKKLIIFDGCNNLKH